MISTVQPTFACVFFVGRVGYALGRAISLDIDRKRGAGEGNDGGDEDGNDAARPHPGGRAFSITRTAVLKGLFMLTAAGILLRQARNEEREKGKRKREKVKRKRSSRNTSGNSSSFGALPSCTASGTSISCSYEF